MEKVKNEHLEEVAGGHISYLGQGEVRRLNEILGDDGVVVCYGSDGSNSGDIGDDEIVIIKGATPADLEELRAQGDIGGVQVVNGVRCVNAMGAFMLHNGTEETGDTVAGRRISEIGWRIVHW